MGELNREEVDAKIETAEMHMAATIARGEERHQAFVTLMEERDKESRAIWSGISHEMSELRAEVRTEVKQIKSENRDTRKIVVITGISATLTVIVGIAAINSALLTHFQGGVEAGTRMAGEHEAIRSDLRQLAISVAEIKQSLPVQSPANTPPKKEARTTNHADK